MRPIDSKHSRIILLLGLAAMWCELATVPCRSQGAVEIVPQIGHGDFTYRAAYSPNGRLIASGSNDATVKIWDASKGTVLRTLRGHAKGISSVVFLQDGLHLLTGSYDHTIRLWNVSTGNVHKTFKAPLGVRSIALAPSGKTFAFGNEEGTISILDLATGAVVRDIAAYDPRYQGQIAVNYTPDGRFLVAASSNDNGLKVWDANSGALIRTLASGPASALALSRNGQLVAIGRFDKLSLWDLRTGQRLHEVTNPESSPEWSTNPQDGHRFISSLTFSLDGRQLLSGSWDRTVRVWDVATATVTRTIKGFPHIVYSLTLAPDGTRAVAACEHHVLQWNLPGGAPQILGARAREVPAIALSPDGDLVLVGGSRPRYLDLRTGAPAVALDSGDNYAGKVAISRDGRRAVAGSADGTIKLWDAKSGLLIRSLRHPDSKWFTDVAFSPDGRQLVSVAYDKEASVRLWDLEKGNLIRSLDGQTKTRGAVFSADGQQLLTWGEDGNISLFDAVTGSTINRIYANTDNVKGGSFSAIPGQLLSVDARGGISSWDAKGGRQIRLLTESGRDSIISSATFSADGRFALTADRWEITLWDLEIGTVVRRFEGHAGNIKAVAITRDNRRIVSTSEDNTIRVWATSNGKNLATIAFGQNDERLSLTAEGFFDASSPRASALLSIVRGLNQIELGQIWQSLFNPDLVAESLNGDPNGEVQQATKALSLDKVVDSGPAPTVAITSHKERDQSASDLIKVTAKIRDEGKGIGRIEWRINGVTARVSAGGRGPELIVTEELALDPGDNVVEVVAYNASNLLASVSARSTISFTGAADAARPTLHVLAIGINAYVDNGWTDAGKDAGRFAPLSLAVKDATAIAADLKRSAMAMYKDVNVVSLLDEAATLAGLEGAIEKLSREIRSRDSFILFVAAHGISSNGRFFMIPQDYQGGPNPDALNQRAVGQERLQDWLGNRIKAKRAVVLLDTCESGALTAGYLKSRTSNSASDAAVGRLHEATGRPVLTAAAIGQFAWEGSIGQSKARHGLFTWALLDALRNGDSNGNGTIELSELVAHVQSLVPKLAADLGGIGRAAIGVSRSTGGDSSGQSARFGSIGADFSLTGRLPK